MKEQQEQNLYKKFPNLYRGSRPDQNGRVYFYGFECQEGWYKLIYNLSEKIEREIIKLKKSISSEEDLPSADQVKSKFGTLRFYMNRTTDRIEKLIDEAETLSETTCEVCGAPGKIYSKGWITVYCPRHTPKK